MFLYRQVDLPVSELRNSLCKIYGLGFYKSNLISAKLGISNPFFLSNMNLYNFYLLSMF